MTRSTRRWIVRHRLPADFVAGWYVRKLAERVIVEGPMSYRSAELLSMGMPDTRPVYLTRSVARGFVFRSDP